MPGALPIGSSGRGSRASLRLLPRAQWFGPPRPVAECAAYELAASRVPARGPLGVPMNFAILEATFFRLGRLRR
jgi:hypothetical protein